LKAPDVGGPRRAVVSTPGCICRGVVALSWYRWGRAAFFKWPFKCGSWADPLLCISFRGPAEAVRGPASFVEFYSLYTASTTDSAMLRRFPVVSQAVPVLILCSPSTAAHCRRTPAPPLGLRVGRYGPARVLRLPGLGWCLALLMGLTPGIIRSGDACVAGSVKGGRAGGSLRELQCTGAGAGGLVPFCAGRQSLHRQKRHQQRKRKQHRLEWICM
jgi:hypothetical protein